MINIKIISQWVCGDFACISPRSRYYLSVLSLAAVLVGCAATEQSSSSATSSVASSIASGVMSSVSSSVISSSVVSSSVASSSIPRSSSSVAISSNSSSVAFIPADSTLVYANNAGGPEVTLGGITYQADRFFDGGTAQTTTDPIAGTAEDALYQSERWGKFKYEVPVTNSTYSVALKFSEPYHTAPSGRYFSVTVEGHLVFSDLDLFAQVGHDTAYNIDVPGVMVVDGMLTIELTASVHNATVAAFAIYSNTGGKFIEPPPPEVGAAKPSAGCGKQRTLTNGSKTIQSSGAQRTYILDVPSNYNNTRPYRLVFGFHPFYGSQENIASGAEISGGNPLYAHYGLKQLAGDTTIFVAPNGVGGPNGWPNGDGKQTVFFDDMVKQLTSELCIDESRIFANGFSYGAGMTYGLACARPNVLRAVTTYAVGNQVSTCVGGTKPMAYLGIHGISDGVLGIDAGRAHRDRFVKLNGCTTMTPQEPNRGSLTHSCISYTCPDKAFPVRWCAFDGDHIPAPRDGASGTGTNTWVPKEVWSFFSQF